MRTRSIPVNDEAIRRFNAMVDTSGDCWVWQGARLPTGYGQFSIGSTVYRAHRVAWTIHNGQIPDGAYICHRCDNPPCVHPEHLFLGDNIANMRDMVAKGRCGPHKAYGEVQGSSKLTVEQARMIRAEYQRGGISMKSLGRKHGISASVVCNIVNGKAWVLALSNALVLQRRLAG